MPNASPEILANPERLDSLRRLCLLDTPADPAFDRLTQLAIKVLDVPMAVIALVEDRREYLLSQAGVREPWASRREMPLEYSYCQHVVALNRPLVIVDAREHELVADNLATLELGRVAYAGIPLKATSGEVFGAVCVMDTKPREWTEQEVSILSDLTDLVMSEIDMRSQLIFQRGIADALRTSEQQLMAVIAGAPVIVTVIDMDGTVILNEGKGLEYIGTAPNSLVGRNLREMYGNQPEILSAMKRALSGDDVSIVVSAMGIDPTHYEVRASPLYDSTGAITGAIGVATDVTDRFNIEQALEETIQQLTILRRVEVELSERLDLNSVLTITMDTALRATGAEHGFIALEEAGKLRTVHTAGAYVKDMIYDANRGIVGRAMRTLAPQFIIDAPDDPDYLNDVPGVKSQMTIPLVHRDHLIGVLNLKTGRKDLFTRDAFDFLTLLAGHITIAIDNAQLYRVSQQQLEELHTLYSRVSELEQLKTDMIRITAHDLRNPLGVMSGYIELMQETPNTLTDDQKQFLDAMRSVLNRMFKIVNDILSLQRIEAIQSGNHLDTLDLTALVQECFDSNAVTAVQKGQDYIITLPHGAVTVNGDATQLREAVENLIGNAIKYTPEGGTVQVQVERVNGQARFEVADSGLGVPVEQQERLFQPYFRASNARMAQIEGTGLGLHLVKKIIERHGGNMRFESTPGEGSRFGFELPMASD